MSALPQSRDCKKQTSLQNPYASQVQCMSTCMALRYHKWYLGQSGDVFIALVCIDVNIVAIYLLPYRKGIYGYWEIRCFVSSQQDSNLRCPEYGPAGISIHSCCCKALVLLLRKQCWGLITSRHSRVWGHHLAIHDPKKCNRTQTQRQTEDPVHTYTAEA